MPEATDEIITKGEEVVKASGELSATVEAVTRAAEESKITQHDVESFLTTLFKALAAAFK